MQNSVGKKSLRNCLDRVRLASIKPTLVPRSTEPQVIIEQAHAQACLYLLMKIGHAWHSAWVGLMRCQYYPRFPNQHSQCTVTSFERVIKT